MTDKTVYFGTAERMFWVPAPLKGMVRSRAGAISTTQLMSGMTHVERSGGYSTKYETSWLAKEEALENLRAVLSGVHGPPPYYFLDPFARNLLPPNWATPRLRTANWPAVFPLEVNFDETVMPAAWIAGTPSLPRKAYLSTISGGSWAAGGESVPYINIPVPPQKRLDITRWGSAVPTQLVLQIDGVSYTLSTPLTGSPAGQVVAITNPSTTDVKMVKINYQKIDLGTSSVTLGALMAQLADISAPAATGKVWYPGEGVQGLDFDSEYPSETPYTAPGYRMVGINAKFAEVKAWRYR